MTYDDMSSMVEPIVKWYEKEQRSLPWREDTSPYHVWVSEIMLQQTRIDTVIPYYRRFLERLPDVKSLAHCPDEELLKLWEGLGYYSRVRNMKKAALMIEEEYGGDFPDSYELLVKLPGIGTYTAGAIASISFEKPAAAVDGNVLRVMTRLLKDDTNIMEEAFRKKMKKALEEIYPKKASYFTQGLMELGEVICLPAGAPLCASCPVKELCASYNDQTMMNYPVKEVVKKKKYENYTVLFIENEEGKILLSKRPDTGLLAGLYELPHLDGNITKAGLKRTLSKAQINVHTLEELKDYKHIFSHIEWDNKAFYLVIEEDGVKESISQLFPQLSLTWCSREELEKDKALPTAFKKPYMEVKKKFWN